MLVMNRKPLFALTAAAIMSILLVGYYVYHDQIHTLPFSWTSKTPQHQQPQQQDSSPELPLPTITPDRQEEADILEDPERRAYATFLSTRITDPTEHDPYFTAVRVLSYQLLHQPDTRGNLSIPFIVLVAPHVSAEKRAILAEEGATVLPVELLEPETDWVAPGQVRFIDQFTKLRLWQQTQYERILYLDADMLLLHSLDAIWDEPVALKVYKTLPASPSDPSAISNGTDALNSMPSNYTIVGVSDTGGPNHPFPPPPGSMLNGGFFLLRPSLQMFKYYVSLLNTPNSFNSALMEQSLLNQAHRTAEEGGRMPWEHFPPGKWNVNWPRWSDVKGGAATLHDKFWDEDNENWIERKLVERWWRVQGQMEGYWDRMAT